MIGGAVLNATAFIGGNYLARALGGGDKAALGEKKRHDKALEDYQAAYAKYTRDRTQLLDWIATNAQTKEQAKQNMTNTDYAFKQGAEVLRFLSAERAAEKRRTRVRGRRGSRSGLRGLPVPLNFFTPYLYGRETRKDLLQPRGLLERHSRDQKIGRGRQGT